MCCITCHVTSSRDDWISGPERLVGGGRVTPLVWLIKSIWGNSWRWIRERHLYPIHYAIHHINSSLITNQSVSTFLWVVMKEIESIRISKNTPSNLTGPQLAALEKSMNNLNITVKPPDKGENTVIMDNSQHERMCMRILTNANWYHPISPLLINGFNTYI